MEVIRLGICTVYEEPQFNLNPSTARLAVMLWPESPVVSTVIEFVPCPLVIVPAETVQFKTGVMPGVPPLTVAVNATGAPTGLVSGALIVMFGQSTGGGGHSRTTTFVEVKATQPSSRLLSTSTRAV